MVVAELTHIKKLLNVVFKS